MYVLSLTHTLSLWLRFLSLWNLHSFVYTFLNNIRCCSSAISGCACDTRRRCLYSAHRGRGNLPCAISLWSFHQQIECISKAPNAHPPWTLGQVWRACLASAFVVIDHLRTPSYRDASAGKYCLRCFFFPLCFLYFFISFFVLFPAPFLFPLFFRRGEGISGMRCAYLVSFEYIIIHTSAFKIIIWSWYCIPLASLFPAACATYAYGGYHQNNHLL